jgi:glycine hydroxymethyltransferase
MTSTPNGNLPSKLAIAADHGGVDLKNAVVAHLKSGGYGVEDLGVHSHDSVDYPDYAELVADRVLSGERMWESSSAPPASACASPPTAMSAFRPPW